MENTILQRALHAEPFAGNQSKFAKAIGTSQQNISNWLKRSAHLPAEYVLAAEAATRIHRSQWRPDIYPAPEAEANAA